jgi:predicted Zn-dependent peptidase
MMFQGSENLGKMEFIRLVQSNGGVLNGSTRFDFTNYFEVVPAHTLETALWAEADRMKGLAITGENLKNQQEVVKNEVRVNVLNQPYGGFPWLDLPQYANQNWYNAHNFYGDLKDLDAATLEDVSKFFKTFYAPNNAVLVVVGDFDPAQTLSWIRKYFEAIPAAKLPEKPDISEPRQEKEKRASKDDKLATRPALAVGYHTPRRNTPEYYAMGLIDEILVQGKDSRLYQALVQKTGLTGDVQGGINSGLGDMFNINGPTLWDVSLFHDKDKSSGEILKVFDAEIERIRTTPVDQATLNRALVKKRSGLYDKMEQTVGFGKADLLASFALFDDDPKKINQIEEEFRRVTPALIQKTAQEYLRPGNRTILVIEPKAEGKTHPKSGSE